MEYTTVIDVLKESGMLHVVSREQLAGATNGVNTQFLTTYKPLYETSQIMATVNDVVVEVASVDVGRGIIGLVTAPPDDSQVVADYTYSPVDEAFVKLVIADAQSLIANRVNGYDACFPYVSKVPSAIRSIARRWASGLLLSKDYGFNIDTEKTSKDGYYKIQRAIEDIEAYIANGGCSGGGSDEVSGGLGSVASGSEGDFIDRQFGRRRPMCGDNEYDRGF